MRLVLRAVRMLLCGRIKTRSSVRHLRARRLRHRLHWPNSGPICHQWTREQARMKRSVRVHRISMLTLRRRPSRCGTCNTVTAQHSTPKGSAFQVEPAVLALEYGA